MKKACFYGYLLNPDIFAQQEGKKDSHTDNTFFLKLKKAFADKGYDLNTERINISEESELMLCYNCPPDISKIQHGNAYLIPMEAVPMVPSNDVQNHKYFKKIGTWNDDWLAQDSDKYFRFDFYATFPEQIKKGMEHKEGFSCIIAGNKNIKHPLEIYSKRLEAIRWFEKNHPADFDLYGIGWDKGTLKPIPGFLGPLRKDKFVKKLFTDNTPYPSYKGMVDTKKDILEKYKFSICYENVRGVTGYITEKVLDCFIAGCVPVYWGASNVEKHIPQGCYIDRREFDSYEKLYDYLKKMSDDEYLRYQDNIQEFLQSDKIKSHTIDFAVNSIVEAVFGD